MGLCNCNSIRIYFTNNSNTITIEDGKNNFCCCFPTSEASKIKEALYILSKKEFPRYSISEIFDSDFIFSNTSIICERITSNWVELSRLPDIYRVYDRFYNTHVDIDIEYIDMEYLNGLDYTQLRRMYCIIKKEL